ncbi:hypothetical protein [Paenibacillus arenosi]|uniref:Uncharacterized protein n=1 Tax=Paenibacillus arenosi TaxID=2774142 RepID=A0ABR9AXZ2_9BACL|nr:hypothetical protein [Paenibacillus arenosi]MBD8498067.1 hypothetical protein [Paenibacillus arenosi]
MYSGYTEHVEELILTKDQVLKMQSAQYAIYEKGFKDTNTTVKKVADALAGIGSILGLVFFKSTPVGVATGVVGILASMIPSTKEIVDTYVKDGHYHMSYLVNFFESNPNARLIKVTLPFIQFNYDGPIRFVAGQGIITGYKPQNGDWVTTS